MYEILKAFLSSITGNDIMKTNNADYGCVSRFLESEKYKTLALIDISDLIEKHKASKIRQDANGIDSSYEDGAINACNEVIRIFNL